MPENPTIKAGQIYTDSNSAFFQVVREVTEDAVYRQRIISLWQRRYEELSPLPIAAFVGAVERGLFELQN